MTAPDPGKPARRRRVPTPGAMAALGLALLLVTGLVFLASRSLLDQPPIQRSATLGIDSGPAPAELQPVASPGGGSGAPEVDPAWLATVAGRTGIPVPALRAYARVQLVDTAGCDVGWTTLAGIGWIESQHGTLDGRTIDDSGHPSRPILGPALNGHGKYAAIPSTPDSLAYHDDRRWEHAVGPMQFLPSSWRTWAADGDGDGTADPQDLDDAAATAAHYLCASGTDLASGAGWQTAILSYNHAQEYVDAVRGAALSYAEQAAG
ncbi:MAG: lytic murein transglycosylase [Nocardioides sp.]